jgi:glutathione S-transferase
MSLPHLYSGTKNASSWAMRAWLALREAQMDFDETVIDIRRPVRFPNLRALSGVSPAATVPLLVVGDTVLFDSMSILEFANDTSGGFLLPSDLLSRGQARSLLGWQHSGLSNICSRISFESAFYPLKRILTRQEQREAERLFDHSEQLLSVSGGPFLFGILSLADLALTPTLIRLSRHRVELERHPRSGDWIDQVLALSSVGEWLSIADQLPHIWYDEYLGGEVPLEWDVGAVAADREGASSERLATADSITLHHQRPTEAGRGFPS